MKLAASVLAMCLAAPLHAEDFSGIEGEWIVDLRVDAAADAPYTKPMVIKVAADRGVSGSFYNSDIIDGRASATNGRTCFAFKTSDGRGLYQTSGCLIADRIVGQSWSEERKFLLNWTAARP